MRLADEIMCTNVQEKQIVIYWLGQAGFVIKDSSSRTIAIDLYLTDCCERLAGFKRLSPKLILPSELKTDILFCTHDHPDHFDIDAVPIIMGNSNTRFVGSKTAVQKCGGMGINESRLTAVENGETADFGWVKFSAVYADHGKLSPDAIGAVIQIDGIKVYVAGDTAYRPKKMQAAIKCKPDIIILPINGAYGNLNEEEAAKLAYDTQAKVAVPCHYWTFAVHGGDPQAFEDKMKKTAPQCKAAILCQGESFIYKSSSL